MTIAAAILLALLFIPAYAAQEKRAAEAPLQVVTTPTSRRIALVAVDGLTYDIFKSRPALANALPHAVAARPLPGESATERWASVGTGVPPRIHGVRAIEGLRFAGGPHVIQSLSRDDFVLHTIAPALRLGRREPLPPTVRRRDYVWEIVAARGTPSAAVNWWTTPNVHAGALDSIGQESIFAAAHGDPVRVDEEASKRLVASIRRDSPRFVTVYLPALDVVLNRLPLDASSRLAASVRALDGIEATVSILAKAGYEVVVAGLPGDRQPGSAVIASTSAIAATQVFDVAPSILNALGFPASSEMQGASAGAAHRQLRNTEHAIVVDESRPGVLRQSEVTGVHPMKKTATILFSLVAAASALAQVPPISVDDLLAIKRVGSPRLSPDGKWIAFDESTIDLKANGRHSAIHLLPAGGGTSRTITDGAKQDEGPAWSPDGKWIAVRLEPRRRREAGLALRRRRRHAEEASAISKAAPEA